MSAYFCSTRKRSQQAIFRVGAIGDDATASTVQKIESIIDRGELQSIQAVKE
jgi:hypothetical protein